MTIQSEPPQAKGVNTDPINIQTVDPMTGIKGIIAPSPNNMGSVNISYPISIPEGINGMTPQINLSYSGPEAYGNCGFGWNLFEDKIEVDTKNGVPKYDGNNTLLYNGQELIGIGGGIYRAKKEMLFSKIVKSGNMFTVYEIDGTKKYYGENDNTRLYNPIENSKIFRWNLTRILKINLGTK